MEERGIEDIVEEINGFYFDGDIQTKNEYVEQCQKLDETLDELANINDDVKKNLFKNLIPAFDGEEEPTYVVIENAYQNLEDGEEMLKELLYETRTGELFYPVVVDETYLKTPNQKMTHHAREKIATFFYEQGLISLDELQNYVSLDGVEAVESDEEDDPKKYLTDNTHTQLLNRLNHEEREMLEDDAEREILYFNILKELSEYKTTAEIPKEFYGKAKSMVQHGIYNDGEAFYPVLDSITGTEMKEDSELYMRVVRMKDDGS